MEDRFRQPKTGLAPERGDRMTRGVSWAGLLTVAFSNLTIAEPSSGAETAAGKAKAPNPASPPAKRWVQFSADQFEAASLSPGTAQPERPRPRTTLVVDVDETLSITDYNSLYLGIGSDDSRPLHGAPEAMRALAKEFDIVYLTARPNSLVRKTLRWLTAYSFPLGPIFTSPSIFGSRAAHKQRTLAQLRSRSPNMLIGIGDKAGDAASYRAYGMLAVVVNPWRKQQYRRDDIVLRNWDDVAAFFRANQALLTNPGRLATAMRAGQLGQRLQANMYD